MKKEENEFMFRLKGLLEDGKWLAHEDFSEEEYEWMKPLFLISAKKVLYVANVSEEELLSEDGAHVLALRSKAKQDGSLLVKICSKIEAEIAELETQDERAEFLESVGLEESGLNTLIRTGYDLLGLQTYFTAGEGKCELGLYRKGLKLRRQRESFIQILKKGL